MTKHVCFEISTCFSSDLKIQIHYNIISEGNLYYKALTMSFVDLWLSGRTS